jgi:malonate-semialdehyde dehydrogenase (acetylating)/methylmalonate-semialdehyde dehydrogenase
MNAAVTTELRTIGHWIGGEGIRGESGRTGPVYNPATGEQTAEVTFASVEEIDRAVGVASEAYATWRHWSLSKRAELFFRIYQLLDEHRDELARLLTAEHGKVLSDAHGEVQRGIEVVEYVCGIPELLKGQYSEQASTGIDVYSIRQPLGVVAGITPFNFPAMVPMWMWAPAIACGNAFILKPSEKDPSASILTAELLKEAGLPDGVFNVIQGDKVAVDAILEHPGIAAVSFVGSTPIARYIHGRATATGKRVQALGGAKNHAIILPDADLEFAADHLSAAAFGSAGERCMAISAAVAVGGAGDPLMDILARKAADVVVGPGRDPRSEMGPVVTAAAKERIEGLIGTGEQQGAKVLVDGRGLKVPGHEDGFFVGPTVIDQVGTDMDVYTEEIFGPVLSVVRSDSVDAAIELINANPYGNGTAIFTNDGGAAWRILRHVQEVLLAHDLPKHNPV